MEDEPWDSGDRMTPDDRRRQEELNTVHDRLQGISNSSDGYRKGPYVGGSLDLAAYGLTFWWFGSLPPEARAVIDEARSQGITVTALAAPFSRAELDASLQRLRARSRPPDIGLGFIVHDTDGSGFTIHFRTTSHALDAMRALHRIEAAALAGRDPDVHDLPYLPFYAPTGPVITISPDPMAPDW